jgi:hypothetical protein
MPSPENADLLDMHQYVRGTASDNGLELLALPVVCIGVGSIVSALPCVTQQRWPWQEFTSRRLAWRHATFASCFFLKG